MDRIIHNIFGIPANETNLRKMYDPKKLVDEIELPNPNKPEKFFAFPPNFKLEHKDGSSTEQKTPLKKSIYSLYQLFTIMKAANYRYLEFSL